MQRGEKRKRNQSSSSTNFVKKMKIKRNKSPFITYLSINNRTKDKSWTFSIKSDGITGRANNRNKSYVYSYPSKNKYNITILDEPKKNEKRDHKPVNYFNHFYAMLLDNIRVKGCDDIRFISDIQILDPDALHSVDPIMINSLNNCKVDVKVYDYHKIKYRLRERSELRIRGNCQLEELSKDRTSTCNREFNNFNRNSITTTTTTTSTFLPRFLLEAIETIVGNNVSVTIQRTPNVIVNPPASYMSFLDNIDEDYLTNVAPPVRNSAQKASDNIIIPNYKLDKAQDDNDEDICKICSIYKENITLVPCVHSLCTSCAKNWKK